MPVALLLLLLGALLIQQPATTVLQAQAPAASALDFEYFRTKVQPILLASREGFSRCASCHMRGTPMRLELLAPGTTTWSEEQTRKNFEVVALRVQPRNIKESKLLMHPLSVEAGGEPPRVREAGRTDGHAKHWDSISNPEWQTLANWVCGRKTTDKMLVITGTCE